MKRGPKGKAAERPVQKPEEVQRGLEDEEGGADAHRPAAERRRLGAAAEHLPGLGQEQGAPKQALKDFKKALKDFGMTLTS